MNMLKNIVTFFILFFTPNIVYGSFLSYTKSAKIVPDLMIDVDTTSQNETIEQTPLPPSKPKQTIRKKIEQTITYNNSMKGFWIESLPQESVHRSSPEISHKRSGSLTSTEQSMSYDKDDITQEILKSQLLEKKDTREQQITRTLRHFEKLHHLERERKELLLRHNILYPQDQITDDPIDKEKFYKIIDQL
jgi:hypothetical protein